MGDRERTQEFEIQNILINYCGATLHHDLIVEIMAEIKTAMNNGPCSWAFKATKKGSE